MSVKLATAVVEVRGQTAQFSRNMKTAERGLGTVKKAAIGLGGALAAAFAGRRMLRGVHDLLKAFSVQEDAIVSMRASLEVTGRAGAGALDKITASAADLQKATTKGDEAIILATASFSQLATALSVDELVQAQKAIIGIADTFMKGDIGNAALIMGKSLTSSTNALVRYGIEIDTTASQSEKLQQILAQSNKFFEVSAARAKTLAGRAMQLSNAWGDLKEQLGEAIVEGTKLEEALTMMTTFFSKIGEMIEDEKVGLARVLQHLGEIMGSALIFGFTRALQELPQVFSDLAASIPIVGKITTLHRKLYEETIGAAAEAAFRGAADKALARMQALINRTLEFESSTRPVLPSPSPTAPVGLIPPDVAGPGYGPKIEFRQPSMKGYHPGLPSPPTTGHKDIGRVGAFPGMPEVEKAAAQFQSAANITVSAFGQMVNAARMGSQSMLESIVNMIGAVLQQLAGAGTFGGGALPGIISGVGQVLSFQSGGVVPGIGSRPVPALVHPGETVIPKGGAGHTVIVNQELNFNAAGFIGPEWWQENKGNVLQLVAEGAQEAPGFARALKG